MVMIMAGLERASKGRVVVDGADYAAMNEDALALFRRNTIGIVFQSFHLVPAMTALENVAIPLELAGRSDAFDRARAELETVGLGHRLSHYPSQMSGGEQQRVALARAFATEPKLILADEPTGNLDGANGRAVVDLLFGAQQRLGTTLLLITHDAALAEHCHRVLRMEDGHIVSETTGTAQLPSRSKSAAQ
jgi:putative ABC transport system ATP-binding protein